MMPAGRGRLDVGAILRGDFSSGMAGVSAAYEHRISKKDALFAEAMTALGWGAWSGLHYEVGVGWRHRF
jgi:hypothetical protein